MKFNYGVMQGRLSRKLGKRIQAFPKNKWQLEFPKAKKLGLKSIEWTIDSDDFHKNPIFSTKGRSIIKRLSKKYSIKVENITGDYFMENPFWKIKKNEEIIENLKRMLKCCKALNMKYLVIPLVDNGSIKNTSQIKNLLRVFNSIIEYIKKSNVKIVFESDFSPKKLREFINLFDKNYFGINYDVGNSAGLGYRINDEFECYGKYIYNVHIKDRYKNGKSVKLGEGNVDFFKLFKNLKNIKFKRNLILQTARSKKNQHMNEIKTNLNFLIKIQNV